MAQTATLTGLGSGFTANALSRNGKVVVGVDTVNNMAAYWSNGTVTDLGGVSVGSVARSCNVDGSVIVGLNNGTPFIWQNKGSGYILNALPLVTGTTSGYASLISADGSVIAGYCIATDSSRYPAIWTSAGVYVLTNVYETTTLNAISDDGSTIACDLTGNYSQNLGSLPVADTNIQESGVVHISGLGAQVPTDEIFSYYNNSNDPNHDVEAGENLYCLTADGSTQYGGSFDVYTQEFNGTSNDYANKETDGFWTVANTGQLSSPASNFINFEPHSCNGDGSVLGGYSVKPTIDTDMYGNPYLSSFQVGNSELAFDNQVVDLNQFLTAKGANTSAWTLTNVSTQGISSDGSVVLGIGAAPGNASENFIATISPKIVVLDSAPTITGGDITQEVPLLDYPAPADTTVYITSNNLIAIPNTSVVVLKGNTTATLLTGTDHVTQPTTVQLTATLGPSSVTTTVTVNPITNPITAFYPSASTVVGGNTILGYVQLGNAVYVNGPAITLTSNNSKVSVPANLTVAWGATTASFSITSTPVVAVTKATLTATFGSVTESTEVTLVPPTITLVRVSPSPVVGGSSTKCAVYLNGKAPAGGETVKLSSSSKLAQFGATYIVPAGTTAGNFTVTTSSVTSSTTVTVSAAVGSTTVTTNFVINPAVVYPAITGFYPSAGVVVGGNAATATVTLAAAAGTGGDVVHLSSNTAGITVPATVTVAAGKTSATVSLTTTPVKAVTKATLTATLGTSTENTVVTVIAPVVSVVRVSPSPVTGGTSTKVAVYLNGKAPTGGLVVSLSSSSTSLQVPSTITVPAGATAANATVTTSKVTAATTVVVTGKTGTVSVDTTAVVSP